MRSAYGLATSGVIFTETTDTIPILDIGPRSGIYE
jgi:hypothetical protein